MNTLKNTGCVTSENRNTKIKNKKVIQFMIYKLRIRYLLNEIVESIIKKSTFFYKIFAFGFNDQNLDRTGTLTGELDEHRGSPTLDITIGITMFDKFDLFLVNIDW